MNRQSHKIRSLMVIVAVDRLPQRRFSALADGAEHQRSFGPSQASGHRAHLLSNPAAEKPPVPADEIIRQFSAHQDEAAQAREGYIYRKTIQLQETGSDGKPSGQLEVTTEFTAAEDGTWRPKTVRKPDSGLHFVDLEPDALQMLSAIPQFPLTTSQLAKYVN